VATRKYRRPPGAHIRPQLAADALVPDCPHPGLEPGELTIQTQTVLSALRNLDFEERTVMAYFFDDIPTAVIAAVLGITEQRLRDVKKRARAALTRALAEQMPPREGKPR
jgi:DNA-directed RNA polymerase specialized sigma subunit